VDQLNADRVRFLTLVRQWHAGHPRGDQVDHCVNVMHWLERALDLEPAPLAARRDMVPAALGHDLYEDSAILPADIITGFGRRVDCLILGLTEGESVASYVERVAVGPEEVRLIKLCDGIDNYGGLVETGLLRMDPAKWVDIVRRQMEPMFTRLASLPFRKYPSAGELLSEELAKRREQFWEAVAELLRETAAEKSPSRA
jgi:hypothetical protein